jgi:hypothetical protein
VSFSACTQGNLASDGDPTKAHTPLVGASALHGVSRHSSGSHLGSTLMPGRAVLTRGVSRRSGSVAYIRADASPTEVLASSSWHRNPASVKQCSKKPHISADQSAMRRPVDTRRQVCRRQINDGDARLFRLVQLDQVAEWIVQEGLVPGTGNERDPLDLDALRLHIGDGGIDVVYSNREVGVDN